MLGPRPYQRVGIAAPRRTERHVGGEGHAFLGCLVQEESVRVACCGFRDTPFRVLSLFRPRLHASKHNIRFQIGEGQKQ